MKWWYWYLSKWPHFIWQHYESDNLFIVSKEFTKQEISKQSFLAKNIECYKLRAHDKIMLNYKPINSCANKYENI